MRPGIFLLAAILALPMLADAEIYKLLPPIAGWQHDEGAGPGPQVNALVPNGQSFSSAPGSFDPAGKGNRELVAYSEEGDYYLLFTVSARTKEALQARARSI